MATRFNPRTHTGCDNNTLPVSVSAFGVSIHAPTRGATVAFVTLTLLSPFQSTHPHGVRPEGIKAQNDLVNVSIHAPTRGATRPSEIAKKLTDVSIHAPTRGATSRLDLMTSARLFQSTHPHGVRLKQGQLTEEQAKFQSTHPHGVRRDYAYTIG